MIKEALQYLVQLGNKEVFEVEGRIYSSEPVHVVEEETVSAINVRSLSGLVEYVKSGFDVNDEDTMMIHVMSPTEVIGFSRTNRDANRNYYIKATAMLPSIRLEHWQEPESFIIQLQSGFFKNEDRDIVLKVIGNIKDEAVNTYGDDGVSQTVTAKTGVATVSSVVVPNPVSLAPYRTFVEVSQPESNFIFRMQSGPRAALFEADGGAWKNEAMNNIKEYLFEELKEQISGGKVIVIG
jgi:hypothetical protein